MRPADLAFAAFVALVLTILAVPAHGQGFMPAGPIFNEIAVGVGGAGDGEATKAQGWFRLSVAMVDSGDETYPYRVGYVLRGEIAGVSQTDVCQHGEALAEEPDHCVDAAVLFGLHVNPLRRSHRRIVPFVEVLAGRYWKGSGLEEPEFGSDHAAVEIGGGVDLRGLDSRHKLRLSITYRHLFGGGGRQAGIGFSYVFGPR